jgi:hypothetical protein
MRFPSFPTFVRAFHTVTNTTSAFVRSSPTGTIGRTIYNNPQRAVLYRSMPNIPFLGALFGSSSTMADNTNYPVSKPEGEWQTQLSPGTLLNPVSTYLHILTHRQSNSASSAKRAPKRLDQAHMTSTTPTPASTHAVDATRLSTKQTTSSTRDADGPPFGTLCLVPLDRSRTLAWA